MTVAPGDGGAGSRGRKSVLVDLQIGVCILRLGAAKAERLTLQAGTVVVAVVGLVGLVVVDVVTGGGGGGLVDLIGTGGGGGGGGGCTPRPPRAAAPSPSAQTWSPGLQTALWREMG